MSQDFDGSYASEIVATIDKIKIELNMQWPELNHLFTDYNIRQAILICDHIPPYCKDCNGNYIGSMRLLQVRFSNDRINRCHLELIKDTISENLI